VRIVVDTNVILAATITHGTSAEVFEHCLLNHVIFSSPFLQEVEEKLSLKFHLPKRKAERVIRFLRNATKKVTPRPLSARVCRDADDDNVLSTAIAAQADCILTGDSHLLELIQYEGIAILKPIDFWKFEKEHIRE
jgi:putative PIN family toxin of toxin-antitoxin system